MYIKKGEFKDYSVSDIYILKTDKIIKMNTFLLKLKTLKKNKEYG